MAFDIDPLLMTPPQEDLDIEAVIPSASDQSADSTKKNSKNSSEMSSPSFRQVPQQIPDPVLCALYLAITKLVKRVGKM